MSMHQQALQEVVNRRMAESPETCAYLARYLERMQSGFYDKEYIDGILQKLERFPYDIYDAYSFSCVHHALLSGTVATAEVNLGVEPRSDTEIDYHNSILAKSGDSPFWGEFWGGKADQDGFFEWDRTIEFDVHHYDKSTDSVSVSSLAIEPRRVPLEVGYTEGSRTMLHLGDGFGLARWPYDSRSILLYAVLDRRLWKEEETLIDWPSHTRKAAKYNAQLSLFE